MSIATGLTYQLPTGPFGEEFIALLGMTFKTLKPVAIGDTLKVEVRVASKSPSKEGRGRVVLTSTVMNQNGEIVMSMEGDFLIKDRKA